MGAALPAVVLALAIVSIVLSRVVAAIATTPARRRRGVGDDGTAIFVACVSFRSATCLDFVLSLFDKAAAPARLRVGVVEYIGHPTESLALRMPADMRAVVRVHTVAISSATTLAAARRLCVRQLFNHEALCVFANEIHLEAGWDAEVVRGASPRAVFTALVGLRRRAMFPVLEATPDGRLALRRRPFAERVGGVVDVVACAADFAVCAPEDVDALLAHDGFEARTASLCERGLRIVSSTALLGTLAVRVHQLPAADDDASRQLTARWRASLDMARASLGLTEAALRRGTSEAVAKYGSTAACQLALDLRRDHDEWVASMAPPLSGD
jgi:hypothetical protein